VKREEFYAAYAEVAVRVGANVQPGQRCLVIARVEHVPLARALGEAAWRAGAGDVELVYWDHFDRYLLARFGEDDALERTAVAARAVLESCLEAEGASISVVGDEAPAYFAQVDPARLARAQPKEAIALAQRAMNEVRDAWTIVAFPEPSWAERVFGEPDVERLIQELAVACRLDEPDPVASWQRHLDELDARAARLDALELDQVHIRGPGTDLVVGLLPGSRWLTARERTRWGQVHCVNLPTEEVFTTPDSRRAEGTIVATRPLLVLGMTIDGLRLTFEEGRIVSATADAGEEFLRQHVATDDGASRLGEIGLVASSRLGARNLLFHNTLFDENAVSHLAYGMAYTSPVDGANELDAEGQAELGINQSSVHVDFPVGGPEVEIDAVLQDDVRVPIIRGEDWVL
jgi:aminopeptidase